MDFASNNQAAMEEQNSAAREARQEQLLSAHAQAIINHLHTTTGELINFLKQHSPDVTVKNPTATVMNVKLPDLESTINDLKNIRQNDVSGFGNLLDKFSSTVNELVKSQKSIRMPKDAPDYTPLFKDLKTSIAQLKLSPILNPNIQVKAPAVQVVNDFKSILDKFDKLSSDITTALAKLPQPDNYDDAALISAVNQVTAACKSFKIAIPHQGPSFKNANGEEVRASTVSVNGKDLIAVVNPDGTNISGGGGGSGTQYAELTTTAPGTGNLSLGRYKSSAPTLTDGQMYGLQLDSSGNLKVTGSLSVGGTTDAAAWTAGSSTFNPGGGVFNDSAAALTAGQQGTQRLTANRGVHVNIRNVSGTELATASNPIRTDPTGSTTQPVSGTVTVNAGTNLNTSALALESGGNLASIKTDVDNLNLSQGSTTSGQKGNLTLGATTTAAPTYTTAQSNPLSLTTAGALRTDSSATTQPVSGTVTANAGTNLNTSLLALESGGNLASIKTDVDNLNLAQGSTTSGQKGNLVLGAVTTSAPTYTTAQSSPISLDTTGALRTTGPQSTVSTNNSTTSALLAAAVFTGTGEDVSSYSEMRVTVFADQASAADGLSLQQSTDNSNWDVRDTYTMPTMSAGQGKTFVVPRQAKFFRVVYTNGGTNQGAFRLQTILNRTGTAPSSNRAGDAYTNETDLVQNQTFGMAYNGTTWDRMRTAPGVTGSLAVAGSTASGSSLAAAPITGGGLGKTSNPTAVSDGQVVNSLHDKLGKQVVVGSIRDLKVQQQTTITSSTSETTVLTAGGASVFLDVYGVIVANTSATACDVAFKDATAGTTRFDIQVPAGETRGFMLNESGAHSQASANNNWTATCGTSVASIKITMLAVKNL